MKRKAFRAALPYTVPVLVGYLVLGISYGVLITSQGFPFWMPMLTSLTIFAGSMEFVLVNLLLSGFDLVQAFLVTLMVNARHLFYGISMLDRYKGMGLKKLYMIFGLTDESFSVVSVTDAPEGVDQSWFSFFVTLLDHSYWVAGATLGGIFGSLIHFNTEGLDFVMTAMFVVIFMEHWKKEKSHFSAVIGLVLPVVCLLIFGAGDFMIPAMASILIALTMARRPLEKEVPA